MEKATMLGMAPEVVGETEGGRSPTGVPATTAPAPAGGAAGSVRPIPDPAVAEKPERRRFTAEYKLRILREADRWGEPGQLGALLRREGLYSSHLSTWRQQRDAGTLAGLAPQRRGPKPQPDAALIAENQRLRRENQRLAEKLRQAEAILEVQETNRSPAWAPEAQTAMKRRTIALLLGAILLPLPTAGAVEVKVISGGESATKAADCRRMLVGPGVNQPDPHPGYAGFVGWDAPVRLRDGTLLVSFSTGYWHASPPTPLQLAPATLAEWRKLGMPTDVEAPRGGRAMLIRSTDDGRTWSKPQTMIDTPWDDRSPAIVELPDGTLVASLFTYSGHGDFRKQPELAYRTGIIRSTDGGQTWEQTPRRLPSPFVCDATDGPPVVLKDGSVLLAVYGSPKEGGPEQVGVFRSTDSGQTWQLLSVVKTDHEMSETGLAQLPDGRLVMIARPEGDIAWSSDGGRTWTRPTTFGMRMYEPGLLVLRDGTLLCLHGSYGAGGFRAIFSADGGQTWIAPARNHGFAVDPSVYGYGRGIELPDGSVLAVYIHTGGHTTKDAQTEALWAIRLRVRPDRTGLDLLPAPGREELVR